MLQFDPFGRTLASLAPSATENTVDYYKKNIWPDDAGGGDTPSTDRGTTIDRALTAAPKEQGSAKANNSNNSVSELLGGRFTQSAPYIAQHYNSLGQFFKDHEAGNAYTNHYTKPAASQPSKVEDPNVFYAQWYNHMRQFAQAREVADLGQTTVRSD